LIAIIDYDIGNLAAVANMFNRLGFASQITCDPSVIAQADRIVLPGNGAFDACMRNLRASNLIPLLEQRVLDARVPLLGICVGAQMLGLHSEEGSEPGLGWLDMKVLRLPDSSEFRVPHMGWNLVQANDASHPMTVTMTDDTRFYFVHSYYLAPADDRDVLLLAEYGIRFAAAVARGNIIGVQFHPEKSHSYGKRLLNAFAKDC
jgi:imidazole glycerol-phosphate synthase subunit HisH